MNRKTDRGLLRTTSTSLYYGFLGLTGAAPKHEAHKAPGEFEFCDSSHLVFPFV